MFNLQSAALALASIALLAISSANVSAATYQKYKLGACGTAKTCSIAFAAIPAGRTAQVTNVSCYASAAFGTDLKKIQLQQLSASNTPGVIVTLIPAPYLLNSTSPAPIAVSMVSQQVLLYASGGQKFQITAELSRGNFNEFSCHISGKI